MDHGYFKDRLSALFDNELPPQEKQVVEEHVRDCAECRAELAKLQQLEEAVNRHSQLGDTDYWEKSAQKIEGRLGFQQQTVITPIRHRWYERGLGWKVVAAAASIGVLAYIGINSEKILKRETLEPKPVPTKQKEVGQPLMKTPAASPGIPKQDTVAAEKVAPVAHEPGVSKEVNLPPPETKIEPEAKLEELKVDTKKLAAPAPEAPLLQRSAPAPTGASTTPTAENRALIQQPKTAVTETPPSPQPPSETRQRTKQQVVTKYEAGRAPAPAAQTLQYAQPVADSAAQIVEKEADNLAVIEKDTTAADSVLTWWRKKRDALTEVRKTLPGTGVISGLSRLAAPNKLAEDRKKQPEMTETEVEKQLLEAWFNIATLTKNATEKAGAIAEIRKVRDNLKSPNRDLAAHYLRDLGTK
ncbi:hypothetical protein C3F09_06260 [candidate division GN15 bacterium]|uniref:Putative zinc-finger domain-containing protein n=1 Tax=candidate division GN15 bacterium TaxID=2072418 RepID=A0A855X679_9BACT|nr:MAG: hypothetical protein C3F09_06260 [candidate division GN15 bacterium]